MWSESNALWFQHESLELGVGSTQTTRTKSGEWVVSWGKVEEYGGWAGRATRSLFICKARILISSLGSIVFCNYPSTIIYTPRTLCNMRGVGSLSLCPAICDRDFSNSFREMKPEFNKLSHWTKFVHIFLDLNVSLPLLAIPWEFTECNILPRRRSSHYLMCFSFDPIFHWKMSKYCPHMARAQLRRESHFIRPAKWGLVLIWSWIMKAFRTDGVIISKKNALSRAMLIGSRGIRISHLSHEEPHMVEMKLSSTLVCFHSGSG